MEERIQEAIEKVSILFHERVNYLIDEKESYFIARVFPISHESHGPAVSLCSGKTLYSASIDEGVVEETSEKLKEDLVKIANRLTETDWEFSMIEDYDPIFHGPTNGIYFLSQRDQWVGPSIEMNVQQDCVLIMPHDESIGDYSSHQVLLEYLKAIG